MSNEQKNQTKTATLGGGCFWCLEAVYQELQGINRIVSGYAGGWVDDPSYRQVGAGNTGHAEVVQLTFNPDTISYEEILQIFFTIHDPTTLNRQGGDIGPMYRSIILYHDDTQKRSAEKVMADIESANIWEKPIVTEIAQFEAFYQAEDYHQNYFRDNQSQPYCQVVIAPKVAKFRKSYTERLK